MGVPALLFSGIHVFVDGNSDVCVCVCERERETEREREDAGFVEDARCKWAVRCTLRPLHLS